MFSLEQTKLFREYETALQNFRTALMNGNDFQAAAWDIYCDELLKTINDRGWNKLLRFYLWNSRNYDETSH